MRRTYCLDQIFCVNLSILDQLDEHFDFKVTPILTINAKAHQLPKFGEIPLDLPCWC